MRTTLLEQPRNESGHTEVVRIAVATLAHSNRCFAARSFLRSLRGPPHMMCSAIAMKASSTPAPVLADVSKYSQPIRAAREEPSSREMTRSSAISIWFTQHKTSKDPLLNSAEQMKDDAVPCSHR
eukprot:COSAG02_NODE_5447_length_4314_cov_27.423488_2_plen_125_part_00